MGDKATKQVPITEVCRPSLNFSDIALDSTNPDILVEYVRSRRGIAGPKMPLFSNVLQSKPKKSFDFQLILPVNNESNDKPEEPEVITISSTETTKIDTTHKTLVPRVLMKDIATNSIDGNRRPSARKLFIEPEINTTVNQNEFFPPVFSTPLPTNDNQLENPIESKLSEIRKERTGRETRHSQKSQIIHSVKKLTAAELQAAKEMEILTQKTLLEKEESNRNETLANKSNSENVDRIPSLTNRKINKSKSREEQHLTINSSEEVSNGHCVETEKIEIVNQIVTRSRVSDKLPAVADRITNISKSVNTTKVNSGQLDVSKSVNTTKVNSAQLDVDNVETSRGSTKNNSSQKNTSKTASPHRDINRNASKNVIIVPESQPEQNISNTFIVPETQPDNLEPKLITSNKSARHLSILEQSAIISTFKGLNQTNKNKPSDNSTRKRSTLLRSSIRIKKNATSPFNSPKLNTTKSLRIQNKSSTQLINLRNIQSLKKSRKNFSSNDSPKVITNIRIKSPNALINKKNNDSESSEFNASGLQQPFVSIPIYQTINLGRDLIEPAPVVPPPSGFCDSGVKPPKKSKSKSSGNKTNLPVTNKTNFERVDMLITSDEESGISRLSTSDEDQPPADNARSPSKTAPRMNPQQSFGSYRIESVQPENYVLQAIDLRTNRDSLKRRSAIVSKERSALYFDYAKNNNNYLQDSTKSTLNDKSLKYKTLNNNQKKINELKGLLTPRYTPPPPITNNNTGNITENIVQTQTTSPIQNSPKNSIFVSPTRRNNVSVKQQNNSLKTNQFYRQYEHLKENLPSPEKRMRPNHDIADPDNELNVISYAHLDAEFNQLKYGSQSNEPVTGNEPNCEIDEGNLKTSRLPNELNKGSTDNLKKTQTPKKNVSPKKTPKKRGRPKKKNPNNRVRPPKKTTPKKRGQPRKQLSSESSDKTNNNILAVEDTNAQYGLVFDDPKNVTDLWRKSILNKPKQSSTKRRSKKKDESVIYPPYLDLTKNLGNHSASTTSGRRHLYSKGQSDIDDTLTENNSTKTSNKTVQNAKEPTTSNQLLSPRSPKNKQPIHSSESISETFLSPKSHSQQNINQNDNVLFKKPSLPVSKSAYKSGSKSQKQCPGGVNGKNIKKNKPNSEPILSSYFDDGQNSAFDSIQQCGSLHQTSTKTKVSGNFGESLTLNKKQDNPNKKKPCRAKIDESNIIETILENTTTVRRSSRKTRPINPIWTTASLAQLIYNSHLNNGINGKRNVNSKNKEKRTKKTTITPQSNNVDLEELICITEEEENNQQEIVADPSTDNNVNEIVELLKESFCEHETKKRNIPKSPKANTKSQIIKKDAKKNPHKKSAIQVPSQNLERTENHSTLNLPQVSAVRTDSGNGSYIPSKSKNLFSWLQNYTTSNLSACSSNSNNSSAPQVTKLIIGKKFCMVPFESMTTSEQDGVEYSFYNALETKQHFGYMKYNPKSSKSRSKSKHTDLNFLLLCGKLQFTVESEVFNFTECGGAITIPKNVRYSIQNNSDEIALLWFHKS